ncbi:MAG: ferrous iron transport protein B [Deltaproteobacteria bacterium]|nr:ferrous iron transport protein B [Deltaproteobacteria bacterium]MBZ0219035.1 ferrous iron transport protein B [Deltaproteobacteria bacterium]
MAQAQAGGSLVLVGNPNVGKSVIFGALTGRYATVSNYPGTSVEISRGIARFGTKRLGIIDSPGVNSLVPMSEDELVTRDILMTGEVSSALQVMDSKNLRRSLLITLQLMEMGLPVTLALNMYDEAGERGIGIDTAALASSLGLKVIPTIATQRWNLDKLEAAFYNREKPANSPVKYPQQIEEGIRAIEPLVPKASISARSIAIMLLSGDTTLKPWLSKTFGQGEMKRVEDIRTSVQARFKDPVGYIINRARLKAVDSLVSKVVTTETPGKGKAAAFIGSITMHPVWGIPILLAVLFIMYEFVGVLGAGVSVDFFEEVVFGELVNPWAERVVGYAFAPGSLVYDLLVGEYGVFTMAFTYAIAIVLPIVSFFFIFFSFLEDSGYLPRLAVMVDRIFKAMGLNGKAVLPMVLGLGCDTMATMTTRILESRKERVIVTLLLALGVPCSAQLGVILGMLGAVSLTASVLWAVIVLLVLFLVGILASKVLPGQPSDFILEIPPVRIPQLSNMLLKTLVRVQWYLKEAVPLFILGTLVLFVLDKLNALNAIQRAVSPVIVGLLSLPAETTEAFLIGFLRRDYGAAGLLALQKEGMLDPVQVVVSLVTMTLFVPCIANLFMIVKERGLKTAVLMSAFIFPFAILVGAVVNLALRLTGIMLQ